MSNGTCYCNGGAVGMSGMRVQLGQTNGGPIVPVTVAQVAVTGVGGAMLGAAAGAVAAGQGRRGRGAGLGALTGAGVNMVLFFLVRAFGGG